jgi:hypothetical protein
MMHSFLVFINVIKRPQFRKKSLEYDELDEGGGRGGSRARPCASATKEDKSICGFRRRKSKTQQHANASFRKNKTEQFETRNPEALSDCVCILHLSPILEILLWKMNTITNMFLIKIVKC